MNALRTGSICSGYGGLDAAVREVLGGELAWVADNDPGAAVLLAHHFPGVPNHGDVTAVDWDAVEQVSIMCGGFPCQDISCAGARAGLRHGNRSGLWHEFVKAIAAHRPAMVVIENVLGLLTARGDEPTAEHLAAEASRDAAGRLLGWIGNELDLAVRKGDVRRARACRARAARVTKARKRAASRCLWHEQRLIRAIGTVLASLAGLGYDAEWVVVTAAAAGACHRRARLFILAFPDTHRVIPVPGEPIAVISDGAWLEPLESLFGAAPFTGRVPASGRMAGGRIYAAEPGPTEAGSGLLPTPQVADSKHAEATAYELAAKGNGQPYGDLLHTATARLLKTPTAQLAVNGGSQHPDKRRAGGHGPTLADQVEHELLPTPMTIYSSRSPEEWRAGRPAGNGATRERIGDLGIVAEQLLPTPNATDWKGSGAAAGRSRDGKPRTAGDADLSEAVTALLPTPVPETLLPTPRASDGEKGDPNQRGSSGDLMLPSAVMSLLPTPNASRVGNRVDTQLSGDGRETPNKLGWAVGALLPTPSVADGTGGHKTRSGDRKGEPLPGGIGMLLPTPTTTDAKGARNATARRSEDASDYNPAWTLSDVIWTGEMPPGTDPGRLLPPAPDTVRWGAYEPAIRRWEAVTGRLAPRPAVPGKTGERLNPALPEWMQGLPAGWITDVPGLSRNAMLKLAGNGVVPQQGALALRILMARAGFSLSGECAA